MLLLEATNIKMFVRDRQLFHIEKLSCHKGDRIGLIGKNGTGKTTLLEILSGKKKPETGTVTTYSTCELLPQLKRTDTTKSGGEVTQQYIQAALQKYPALLLADEPTTHLDTDHIEWLEKKFSHWQGAFILVSHDRAFLDAICTTIWELEDGKINIYKGNYTDYTTQKEQALKNQQESYEQYEKKKKQLEEALQLKEAKAQRATKTPKNVNPKEAKKGKPYFAKKQKKLHQSVKALETRIEKLEKVEKIKEATPIQMNIPNEDTITGRIIIRFDEVEGKINNRKLWSKTSFHIRGGDKLAILGPNGCGKTTLIKKIINEEQGLTISPAVKIGYFSQNIDILECNKTILENVQQTSLYDETFIRIVLARLHFFRDDVYKKVSILSGGERVKVALAKIFLSNINTLILDEPTNFLDIDAVEALESLLKDYKGTIIFATHDRRFVEKIATRILSFENETIHIFDGTFHALKNEGTEIDEDILIIETKIAEVLSRLSTEPSPQLEEEFQRLLTKKRALNK